MFIINEKYSRQKNISRVHNKFVLVLIETCSAVQVKKEKQLEKQV